MLVLDLDDVQLQENATAGGPIRVAFPFHSDLGTASTGAVLFELDPGSELARHTDSAEEVLIVLEGEADAFAGGEQRRLRAGHVAIVPAMVPHSVLNVGAGVLRVLGVFSSATLVATFEEPLTPDGPQVMVAGAAVPIAVSLDALAA